MISGNIEPSKLLRVNPRSPKGAGVYHNPVRHSTLLQCVREACDKEGWGVAAVNVGVSVNGVDMVASLEILSHGVLLPDGFTACLGIFNSNGRARAGRFYAGVTFKGVGMVFSRFGKHRQTTNFDPAVAAAEAAADFVDHLELFPSLIEELRGEKVSRYRASHLFGEAYRKGDRMLPPRAFMRLAGGKCGCRARDGLDPGTSLGVLYKFGKALTDHAPVSQCPRADQLSRMYEFFRMVRPIAASA